MDWVNAYETFVQFVQFDLLLLNRGKLVAWAGMFGMRTFAPPFYNSTAFLNGDIDEALYVKRDGVRSKLNKIFYGLLQSPGLV